MYPIKYKKKYIYRFLKPTKWLLPLLVDKGYAVSQVMTRARWAWMSVHMFCIGQARHTLATGYLPIDSVDLNLNI